MLLELFYKISSNKGASVDLDLNYAVITKDLTKKYSSSTIAVDSLNLKVKKGEIYGLLGPNGAGKTTTGGMLTTRIIPTSGKAYIGGVDVVKNPAKAKRQIGVVPQSNTLDRSLSVEQNLYFHGRYFGMSKQAAILKAQQLLEQFQLSDKSKVQVQVLSGGMAQRLMVARAIMHNPTVLVLDEPTSGLDPQSRLALWDILTQLHKDGQTIILTTHFMQEAESLCQRVAIMDHGKILALGTPDELKKSVGSESVLNLEVSGDPLALAEKLRAEIEDPVSITTSSSAIRVISPAITQLAPDLIAKTQAEGYHIFNLSIEQPSLETVFIKLTGRQLRE